MVIRLPAISRTIAAAVFGKAAPQHEDHRIDWSLAKEPRGEAFPGDGEHDAIYRFEVSGIRLEVPLRVLQPDLWRALIHGYYEGSEIAALQYAVRAGDRVLEVGAGIGFISCFAVTKLKAAQVIAVEADPNLIPIIERTHAINGTSAQILNVAVAARNGTVEFNRQPAFWASSLIDLPGGTKIKLHARGLQSLLDEIDPDVLIVDTEGAEAAMFEQFKPTPRLRHAVVEVHKPHIGLSGIAACFSAMSEAGMAYDPDGSSNTNVVFSRL